MKYVMRFPANVPSTGRTELSIFCVRMDGYPWRQQTVSSCVRGASASGHFYARRGSYHCTCRFCRIHRRLFDFSGHVLGNRPSACWRVRVSYVTGAAKGKTTTGKTRNAARVERTHDIIFAPLKAERSRLSDAMVDNPRDQQLFRK